MKKPELMFKSCKNNKIRGNSYIQPSFIRHITANVSIYANIDYLDIGFRIVMVK